MIDTKLQLRLVRAAVTEAYDEIEQSHTGKTDSHILASLANILSAVSRLTTIVERTAGESVRLDSPASLSANQSVSGSEVSSLE